MSEPGLDRASRHLLDAVGALSIVRLLVSYESHGMLIPDWAGSTLQGALKNPAFWVGLGNTRDLLFNPPVPGREERAGPPGMLIHPPPVGGMIPAGDRLVFGITLIGDAVGVLPLVVDCLRAAGRFGFGADRDRGRGKAELEEVVAAAPDGSHRVIYGRGGPVAASGVPQWCAEGMICSPPFSGPLRVVFLTPTALADRSSRHRYWGLQPRETEGLLPERLPAQVLIDGLLRRVEGLLMTHCGVGLDVSWRRPYTEASKGLRNAMQSLWWCDLLRKSSRSGMRYAAGGMMGHVEYDGDWRVVWPLLCLGMFLSVGSRTSMGHGCLTLGNEQYGIIAASLVPYAYPVLAADRGEEQS